MRMLKNWMCTAFAAVCMTGVANAQTVITEWTFNSVPPDANTTTGTTLPSTGTGTYTSLGGISQIFAAGTTTDTSSPGDNSGLQTSTYPAAAVGSGTAGVRFDVSTVGFSSINIAFEQRNTNTASRFFQLEYTTDGTNFVTTGLPNGGVYSITTGAVFVPFNFDLSAIPAVNNNASFGFRAVAIFDPMGSAYIATNTGSIYGTTGTVRFDLVRVSQGAPPVGACCVSGTCVATEAEAACLARGVGASWGGPGTNCGTFTCPLPTGACCIGTACNVFTLDDCNSLSGVWTINGTCTPNNPCDPVGACCFSSSTGSACLIRNAADCGSLMGVYQGAATVCSPNPCPAPPPGACCDGATCSLSPDPIACYNAGGQFKGYSTVCTPNPCFVPTGSVITTFDFDANVVGGANLSFVATPDNSAANGRFPGNAFDVFGVTDRTINNDFADDSIAFPTDTFGILRSTETGRVFGVEDLLNNDNLAGTGIATWTFNIAGATALNLTIDMAAMGNFEALGAGGGSVADTYNFTVSIDGGTPQSVFTSSIYEGLLPTYTLESGNTNTSLSDPAAINGSMILNRFVTLAAPISGAGNVLTLTFAASNDGGGEVFMFDNIVIRGDTGVPVNGACCLGTTCSVSTAAACTGANTFFAGTGTVCNVPGNFTTPCCKADYNQSGSVTVQDIFDFLAGYFTSSPAADINGGGVSVQDIFDFLAAYFAGC